MEIQKFEGMAIISLKDYEELMQERKALATLVEEKNPIVISFQYGHGGCVNRYYYKDIDKKIQDHIEYLKAENENLKQENRRLKAGYEVKKAEQKKWYQKF